MTNHSAPQVSRASTCPNWLLILVYLLYLGLPTTASVPLFAEIDWLHEGERMGTAQVLLHGGLPFRDVYLPHGLGPEVVRPLAAFWLFGESLAADRLLGLLLAPMAYVAATFYVWKLFPSFGWRIAALLAVTLYPLQLIPRHIVVFLALGFLAAWTHARRPRDLALAGAMTGLSLVGSSFDQVAFLFATMGTFAAYWSVKQRVLSRAKATGDPGGPVAGRSGYRQIRPLFVGALLGLAPYFVYLWLTGTTSAFLNDYVTRALTDAVVKRDPFPDLSLMNITWYAVPSFYILLALIITLRTFRYGDRRWTPVVPTLLFGVFSFSYVLRGCCLSYGKLAVVSFPVVVLLMYALYVVSAKQECAHDSVTEARWPHGELLIGGVASLLAAWVLLHALVRDWTPKQIAPRYVFPLTAAAVLANVWLAATGRLRSRSLNGRMLAAGTVASVVLAAWFYNDAKPQVLAAQIQKVKLVKQAGQVAQWMRPGVGRFTRDVPPFVQDEVLAYLRSASREGKPIVVLSTGSGLYYFLADLVPPNRFPEIYHAMAEGPAREVVEAANHTRAELLVACGDHGEAITGWPMNPLFVRFIAERYRDSGRRLASQNLGEGCPFEVWIRKEA